MTPEQQKEELSRAWLCAVAASCGYTLASWSQDQDCIDVTVGAPGVLTGGAVADPKVDLQLKATNSVNYVRSDHVALQVPRRQYERLTRRSFAEKVLVVLVLPDDPTEWVKVSPEQLVLRKCAYFAVARHLAPIADAESKVVQVPFTRPFTPAALRAMMERVSREEPL